ncbi:putative protein phosphatase 2C 32 [Curcuma longa]|uniref:putative protein phosphatase 2C 32 n=1 Tax=Curcuma longa TaxID=136217 RepID=UPI003D9F8EC1
MSCSFAMANSPVFSPSRLSISCKGSPEKVSVNPSSPLASPPCSSSPFRQRFERAASGLREINTGIGASRIALDASSSPPPLRSSASGSLLKRRRPARIDIPLVDALPLATEDLDDWREVEAQSESYAVCCRRGRKRLVMEDRYKATLGIDADPKLAYFGLFDGHGGKGAAEFASEKMGEYIVGEVLSSSREGFNDVDRAVWNGYLKTDSEFLKDGTDGGASCVTALLRGGILVVSNAGDCRAVLCRAGKAEALTSDHRPSREDERQRIASTGGYVDYCRGTWRLQGSLAVSRGIGDSHLKQWVIAEPETQITTIEAECEFLILASDGLWDKVTNQEAVNIARPFFLADDSESLLGACKKLLDLSASRGSLDDISVIIVKLQHFV